MTRSRRACALALTCALTAVPAAQAAEVRAGRATFVKVGRKPGLSSLPDAAVAYWAIPYVATDSVRTVIRGRVPRSRLWAVTLYQTTGPPIDNLVDRQVRTRRGTFEITVARGCAGASNCLDATRGDAARTQAGVVVLRLYDPIDLGAEESGGVPPPTAGYAGPGSENVVDLSNLDVPPALRDSAADVVYRLAESGHAVAMQPAPGAAPVPHPDNDPAPSFHRFANTQTGLLEWVRSRGAPQALLHPFGALPAIDFQFPANRYGGVLYDSRRGNLELRFKAPTYRRPRWGDPPANRAWRRPGSEQLRYWSVCSYDADLQWADCLRDRNFVVGRRRQVVVLVAPRCPVARYANCVATGGETVPDFAVLMRNTDPSPSFSEQRMTGDHAVEAGYVARR